MMQGEDLAVEGVHIAFLDSLLRTPPSAASAQDSRSVFGGASRTSTKENEMLFYMRPRERSREGFEEESHEIIVAIIGTTFFP